MAILQNEVNTERDAIGKVAFTPEQVEIPRLLGELEEVIGIVGENSYMLEDRITPILRKEPMSTEEYAERGTSTALGETLQSYITRLRRVADHLRDTRAKVEL